MRRTILIALTCLSFTAPQQASRAVFFDDGGEHCKRTYIQNQLWPWPYQCPDRIAVREPFCLMVNNGWRRQNLLGAHHFVPGTNQLSSAGELRVQWIMTQAPPDRREIFVERSLDPDANAQRLVAARDYAAKVTVDGQAPQVQQTYLISEGRPAAVVDAVNVNFMKAMPPPVLPEATAASTGN